MRALSTAALLEAWERGLGLSLFQRALTLLAAADPETPAERLAALPIGQRDSRLLTLRELTFGPTLAAVVHCPRCDAQLELGFNAEETRAASPLQHDCSGSDPEVFTAAVEDGEVQYRLPTSIDLGAVSAQRNAARARTVLLERCVLAITYKGIRIAVADAPAHVLSAVVEHMARVDPQGDVQVTFTCPSCGHQREVAFDIASFFWHEVDAWAARTIRDVHTLAAAYGWREADILAMSSTRRQLYLDLAD
jgi:hypothetical protein